MKLSRINTILLIAIIFVNSVTIVVPLLPALSFWVRGWFSDTEQKLSQQLSVPAGQVSRPSSENRLIIPAMQLDEQIIEGADERALRDGPWRRPHTGTPDKGGNTVISAHRFTYTDPEGSFYHLDTLRKDDEIGIFWQDKRYIYRVERVHTTGPNDTSVEAPTDRPTLTLYTCTPLWLPKDRLVITAALISTEEL